MFVWKGCMRFDKDARHITIRQIDKKDIPLLCVLYDETLIDKSNYKERLNPQHEKAFCKIGGMFSIYGAKELEEIIDNKDNMFMLAAFDENDKPVGIVWSALSDSHFEGFDDKFIERVAFPNYKKEYNRIVENGEIIYGREIIVSPSAKMSGIAACLMYALLYCDKLFGYRYTTGEVYNVHSYEDENGHTSAENFNGRSFHVLTEQTGGDNVCGFKQVKRILDGFTVYYDSEVIVWDYDKIKDKFKEYLKGRGFEIKILE